MKDKNRNKKINPAVAVIAVFLWVIVLTIVLHAYFQQGGTLAKVVEVALIVLTLVGFIACIVIMLSRSGVWQRELTRQLFSIS